MMHVRWIFALLATTVATTVVAEDSTATAVDPNLQRAQAAMADLGQTLRGALQQKIAQDGIVAAVALCHDEAPRIAAEVGARHRVAVGRTSVRHRSPANAPADWQRVMLDDFAARVARGEDAGAVTASETSDGTLHVAKGIKVEAPCLMCHGPKDSIAPEVAQAIAANYPMDHAADFDAGDLRGMIWAEVALDADARAPIAMHADQQSALRIEMRRHLDSVQQIIAALSRQDWSEVAAAAQAFGPRLGAGQGRGPSGGRGMGPGASFRAALPEAWFELARPMHVAINEVGNEARSEQRIAVALTKLAEATAQCTACHATFRIDPRTPATSVSR